MDHREKSTRNLFTDYGLDRVHRQLQDEAWVAAQLTHPNTRFLPVWQLQPLIAPGDPPQPVWLTPETAAEFLPLAASLTVLGVAGERAYATFALPDTAELPETLTARGTFLDLRRISPLLSRFDGGMLAYARAMAFWHAQHRFCGACGSPTESREGGHLRVCANPQCKQQHFPRTDPAIIVCTVYGDKILLGRQPTWAKGRYSNIAGFVAPGESLEDAVAREVAEETGARVAAVHYHSSQPWPFPSSLMLGFTAEAADDTLCAGPDCGDGELEDYRWFTRAEIRQGLEAGTLGLPSCISISFRLIEDWFDAGDQGELAPLKLQYNPD
ncbi:MAG TPA: NAD(+) diphosphatase [Anaerolineae bacterium]|nr:NAD(+) diphosphatase [Anaerolineae bacterium]HQI83559.1 NAD(+) diphosphatase [Anaerolineae bacterium]